MLESAIWTCMASFRSRSGARYRLLNILIVSSLACATAPAPAALTDLSTVPLQTATPLVKPNLFFILDDSGSMAWDFMPDWAEGGSTSLVRNSGYNATYYNPAIRYRPPVRADGSDYPGMSAATTSTWTRVPFDGFGMQTADNTGNNLFTNGNAGATQNLVGNAFYYVFIPGEYCTAPDLKQCVTRSTPSTTHPYPAMLRWCNTANASDCRATRIAASQRGGVAYTNYRAPGMTAQGSLTLVPGSNMRVDIVSTRASYAYPGTDNKAPGRDDCAGAMCTYAEEMTNFANWWAYYRTRMQMAKSAASLAFQDVDTKFRIGYMTINNNNGGDFLNVLDVDTSATGQKYQWYTKLLAAKPGSSTPLRTALSTAGKYFAGKAPATFRGVNTIDPMQYACQRNYTLLSTDGYWNDNATPTALDGSAIGDQDGLASIAAPYKDGNAVANTLADIAQYYFVTDIRSSAFGNTNGALRSDVANNQVPDGRQTMRTSTIGLGASGQMQYRDDYKTATTGDYADIAKAVSSTGSACDWQTTAGTCTWPRPVSNEQTTIDDLWHAAVNGRGTYYSAADPEQLKKGLKDFISEVARGAALQLTPPSVSNLNMTDKDNVGFSTTFTSGGWFGDVRADELNAATTARTGVVLWSQSEPQDSAGGSRTRPVLDNTDFSKRLIYTYEPAAGRSNGLISFEWSSTGISPLPAMGDETRRHFRATAITSLTQMCNSGGSTCLPSGDRIDSNSAGAKGIGGINLVNFLRGDKSLEGMAAGRYYRERAHILGDVVDAKPIYLKGPNFRYTDRDYADFRTTRANRTAMVYVAANDGMLHAFRAKDGTEAWAYVPSLVLPNMYKLADRDYTNRHAFYVNATPAPSDIVIDGKWRTILVGGLGQGGRGYYALDITDADKEPKALWEFTHDRTRGAGYAVDEDLGYSYGQPIITKLADGTWVVIVASGYNNVSPGTGRGYIWVLDAATGQILRKIDTGAGSITATQPGCTATPCPAGLAHVRGFGLDYDRNNLTLRVYGGDLQGNVWRIDISKLTRSGGSFSVTKLATLADANGNVQPVTSTAALGIFGGYSVVFLGTGRYLGQSDIGTTPQQSFYAMRDPLSTSTTSIHGSPRGKTCGANATSGCFVRQVLTESSQGIRTASSTVSYAMDFRTMGGWFIDLPKTGERVVSQPELLSVVLAFTSGIPTVGTACTLGGSSAINFVDARTGLTLPGLTKAGYVDSDGNGPGGGVTLVMTSDGKVRIMTPGGGGENGNGGDKNNEGIALPSIGGNARLSWRELIIDQ